MDSSSRASASSGFDGEASFDAFSSALADSTEDDSQDFAMPECEGSLTGSTGPETTGAQPDKKTAPLVSKNILMTTRQRVSALLPGRAEGGPGDAARSPATGAPSRKTTHFCTVTVLIGGLTAAFTLYLAMLELSPLSLDPLGNSLLFLGLSMAALTVCAVGLILAIRAVLVGRPKHRPATAIMVAVVVVPLLVIGAATAGLREAKREVQDSAVSGAGRTFVWVLELMVEEGVNIGPLARLLD